MKNNWNLKVRKFICQEVILNFSQNIIKTRVTEIKLKLKLNVK